jgi:hypothetical protein
MASVQVLLFNISTISLVNLNRIFFVTQLCQSNSCDADFTLSFSL